MVPVLVSLGDFACGQFPNILLRPEDFPLVLLYSTSDCTQSSLMQSEWVDERVGADSGQLDKTVENQ